MRVGVILPNSGALTDMPTLLAEMARAEKRGIQSADVLASSGRDGAAGWKAYRH